MSIVSVAITRDVSKGQHIQLLLPAATSDIDWEQDWPGDQTAEKADGRGDFEIAKQEISIQRVVLQDVGIRELGH
jgi:hypothetical protein